jgi:hypothetical protein
MSCEDVVIVKSSMFCWSALEGITGTKTASLVSSGHAHLIVVIGCGKVQRRELSMVLCIHVGTPAEQQPCHLHMALLECDQAGSGTIARRVLLVGTLADKQPCHLQMAFYASIKRGV